MRPGKIAGILIPAAVSAGLLLALLHDIPWADLRGSLVRVSRPALALYALATLVGLGLRALRFRVLLPAPRPRLGPILLVTAVQNCVGDLVPGRLASLGSYVYLLVRRFSVGLEPAAATFLISFVLDFATLGPLLALAVAMRLGPGSPQVAAGLSIGWVGGFAVLVFVAAVALLLEFGPIARALSRLVRGPAGRSTLEASGRRGRLAARLESLAGALSEAKRAGTLMPAFLISVAIRLAKYASLHALMVGLLAGAGATGWQPGFWDLIIGISATELIASFPFPALGQFGVWEGGMTGALVLLGVGRAPATIVAVGIHGITQAFEYLLGALALGMLAAADRRRNGGRDTGLPGSRTASEVPQAPDR